MISQFVNSLFVISQFLYGDTMITYEKYVLYRNSKKMKDSDVAKKAGIPASTFSDWKKGKSSPKEAKLIKIANALDVSYSLFMGWVPEDKPSDESVNELKDLIYSNFTENEQLVLDGYRSLSEQGKRQIVTMIAFLKSQENNDEI